MGINDLVCREPAWELAETPGWMHEVHLRLAEREIVEQRVLREGYGKKRSSPGCIRRAASSKSLVDRVRQTVRCRPLT
jgi:hypothetical protein